MTGFFERAAHDGIGRRTAPVVVDDEGTVPRGLATLAVPAGLDTTERADA